MAAGDPGSPARYFSSTAVETSLQSAIPAQSPGQSNTSFIVVSISGFPSNFPYTLIVDPDTSKEEVVTVTAGSSTTLTVTRGGDGTAAVAHSAGAVIRHGVSGRDFRESQTHIAARGWDLDESILTLANQTHVHGIAVGDGAVVGTTKAQTITNKVYSSGTFTGSFTASGATFTSPTISGSPVITGLSSAGMVDSSATPKSYVDAIFGSATSAAASAASAAVSATSAATSATSAAASATAAATSATSAASSATAAATSATSAATSATSASNSASAASTSASSASTSASSALTRANSAATSATSAATSATSAATSASSALTSANSAATSATAAATSATSAASSATAAATSATSASNSASAASTSATSASNSASAASTSASSALTSANSAATSASSALTSANSASTSATSAATSATSAASSATAAASSATAAAASFDAFDDTYLGAKASNPTVDNDGNPLITGALYFNTASNVLRTYTGSAWVDAPQGAQGNKGGVPYTFSTTTTDADPGSGVIRYNNATIASVTQIFVDNLDALGNTQTAWYDTWDDSTNPGQEGFLTIQGNATGSTLVNIFSVTGAVTVASGYYKIPVAYVSGSLPTNTASIAVEFSRTGNAGGWESAQTLRSVTGATDTPTSSDNGKLVTIDTTTGAVTVTINTSLALTAGQRIDFAWIGAATSITFSASSTTVNGTPGLKLRARYSAATLICLSSNNYLLVGDLSA